MHFQSVYKPIVVICSSGLDPGSLLITSYRSAIIQKTVTNIIAVSINASIIVTMVRPWPLPCRAGFLLLDRRLLVSVTSPVIIALSRLPIGAVLQLRVDRQRRVIALGQLRGHPPN